MAGKRGIKIAFVTLLVGSALLAVFWVLTGNLRDGIKISNPVQKLPDGTFLKLVQIDYGKTNLSLGDDVFERWRRRLVSPAGFSFLGRQIIPPLAAATNYNVALNVDDELVFALQHLGMTNTGFGRTGLTDWEINTRAVAFDENGKEYWAGIGRFDILSTSRGSTNPISAWHLRTFPRDGKLVGLRIYRPMNNEWRPVAEFVTRNPNPGPHPDWDAEQLPGTKTVGKLAVTLDDFTVGKRPGGVINQNPGYNAKVNINISENGHRSDAWQVFGVSLSEPNGNRTHANVIISGGISRNGDFVRRKINPEGTPYQFAGALDSEKAWKLQFELNRVKDLAESEIWRMRDLPITPQSTRIAGTNLPFPPQSSGTARYSTNFNGTKFSYTLLGQSLIGRVDPPKPGWNFVVLSITDDQGRNVLKSEPTISVGSFICSLEIPADAQSLSLALAYQKSEQIEFIVKPRLEIYTNASRPRPSRIPTLRFPTNFPPPRTVLPVPNGPTNGWDSLRAVPARQTRIYPPSATPTFQSSNTPPKIVERP